jgi:hypothetical protein
MSESVQGLPRLCCALLIFLCACGKETGNESSVTESATSNNLTVFTGITSGTEVSGNVTSTIPSEATDVGTAGETEVVSDSASDGCSTIRCTGTTGSGELPCDIWAQDCPRGQKCNPVSEGGVFDWNGDRCIPVPLMPKGIGEACSFESNDQWSGVDDCALGAFCWAEVCTPICIGSPDNPSCSPGLECVITSYGALAICLPECIPLGFPCQDAESLCIPDPDLPGLFHCVADETGDQGQVFSPCQSDQNCDYGMMCGINVAIECPPDQGCCTPFCDLTQPICPGDGQTCNPWNLNNPVPPGLQDVGFCTAL